MGVWPGFTWKRQGDSNPKLLERPRGAQTLCHLYQVWWNLIPFTCRFAGLKNSASNIWWDHSCFIDFLSGDSIFGSFSWFSFFLKRFFFFDLSLKKSPLTWLFHLVEHRGGSCKRLSTARGPAAVNHWPLPSSSCYEETENYKRCGENSWKPRRLVTSREVNVKVGAVTI